MDMESRIRSHRNQMNVITGLLVFSLLQVSASAIENNSSSYTVINLAQNATTQLDEVVPGALKVSADEKEGGFQAPKIFGDQIFTLKTDPVTGQVDFNTKTVDISVINQQRDQEKAEKVAVVQQDLQSRITSPSEKVSTATEASAETAESPSPAEVKEKNEQVKKDIESRVVTENDTKRYRLDDATYEETFKHPIKRADVDYYDDEPVPLSSKAPLGVQPRTTTQAPKEDESFFSIFESLFGPNEEESQTKKKANPEDDPMFKESDDFTLKDDIRNVGSMLKPIRTDDNYPPKQPGLPYGDQEYRITNNFRRPEPPRFPNPALKPKDPFPVQQNYPRPGQDKPFNSYKPYSTPGYEDYDLEEFMDKSDIKAKPVSSPSTYKTISSTYPSIVTTTKRIITSQRPQTHLYHNEPREPSKDIADSRSDEILDKSEENEKNEITEPKVEKPTEKPPAYLKLTKPPQLAPTTTTTTTTERENYPSREESYETKTNQIVPPKIQDSANFYNMINLPVRYSTKDTAIPLISTSYANTKIQGLGANKFEKPGSGKYPNHKYDANSSTTKRPNYWSARRTTQKTYPAKLTTSTAPPKTTTKSESSMDLSDLEYDDMAIGAGADFGGYGHKEGVEVKTQAPAKTSTETYETNFKETTTRRNYDNPPKEIIQQQETGGFRPTFDNNNKNKELEKKTEKPFKKPEKEVYDEYEYDSYPAQVYPVNPPKNTDQSYQPSEPVKNVYEQNKPLQKKPPTSTETKPKPVTNEQHRPSETSEYEYYDYDSDGQTTTTQKYRVKYPSLSKEKIKPNTEKVAVVVPSKTQDLYEDRPQKPSTLGSNSISTSSSTSTTSTTSTERENESESEEFLNFQNPPNPFLRPNQIKKEPAPVFEESEESDRPFPSKPVTSPPYPKKTDKPFDHKAKPIIVTANRKDQENNVNIVLVPAKGDSKNEPADSSEEPNVGSNQKVFNRPNDVYQSHFDYTTEFTVGAVQGHGGSHPVQGHYVATSLSTSPFDDKDEPFRPIPRPPGMTASFQVIGDESELPQQSPDTKPFQADKRPPAIPTLHLHETEPIHKPHEFIPSPQFHRPEEVKPVLENHPGDSSVDYDFDVIQTEPKPGQYVIFSKPQLNPEMNENQIKKKPEVSTANKPLPSIPHFHDGGNSYSPENQKHPYHSKPGPLPSNNADTKLIGQDKTQPDPKRPGFGLFPDVGEDRPSLQLTPPKGTQTEKPFEANFLAPEQKPESVANYPRPHWEKNGKPSFLLNSLASSNEISGSRQPPLPPQMAPTLVPPNNGIPQRFRKPVPPNLPPIRKNFNEAGISTKPKPNLPNILPQFRPNAKIGGPYQRPFHRPPGPGFNNQNPNRRNGPNRYSENGNFPYLIQHPSDKDRLMHRDFEVDSAEEIVPKFINSRGKLPSEMLEQYGVQKRYGTAPMNVHTKMRTHLTGPRPIEDPKILRRLQRTPVTTLQMLQQTPGIKTHKTPVTREDNADPMAPLIPPVYRTYKEEPNGEKNLYLVYPSNVPSKNIPYNLRHPNTDAKKRQPTIKIENPDTFTYNYTKPEDQYPLLNPTKRTNYYHEKIRNEFPYGFIKPDDKLKLVRKSDDIGAKRPGEIYDDKEIKPNIQDYMPFATKKPILSTENKDEKIDMNLHMQSNNQWNQVQTIDEDTNIKSESSPETAKVTVAPANGQTPFKITEYGHGTTPKYLEDSEVRVNPPSEYHLSIKDENNSAFTLGAVMHTFPENNKKGQVASVSLSHDGSDLVLPNLKVNERIANGKIVTVSMPLDVKQEPKEEVKIPEMPKEPSSNEKYLFQAPFQASSSITSNEAEPTNQGWSIVKNPSEQGAVEKEDKEGNVESPSNNTTFNFENFQPELIGGFKPIYELPEQETDIKRPEEIKDRGERIFNLR